MSGPRALPMPPVPLDLAPPNDPALVLPVAWLGDGTWWQTVSGEELKAALALWMRAITAERPLASLPREDRLLAAYSGAGVRWTRVKGMALAGFTLCADGRLYHPILVRCVLSAAKLSEAQRARAAKRWANLEGGHKPRQAKAVPGHRKRMPGHRSGMPGHRETDAGAAKIDAYSDSVARPATESSEVKPLLSDLSAASYARDGQPEFLLPINGISEEASGFGANAEWRDQGKRDGFAISRCVPFLPGRDDGERWQVALAAENTEHPQHDIAVKAMLTAARQAGVGWISPERRRARQAGGAA